MDIRKILRLLIIAIVMMAAFSLLGVVADIAQVLLWTGLKVLVLLLVVFVVLSLAQAVLKR